MPSPSVPRLQAKRRTHREGTTGGAPLPSSLTAFAAEAVRLPPSLEEDALRCADGSATDDAGPAAKATAALLARTEMIARTHQDYGGLCEAHGTGAAADTVRLAGVSGISGGRRLSRQW